MEEPDFDARALRLAATPWLPAIEVARQMGMSRTFYLWLEAKKARWPEHRKAQFLEVLARWKENPVKLGPRRNRDRKGRSDKGVARGPNCRTSPKPELATA